jgi:hypothetical protein
MRDEDLDLPIRQWDDSDIACARVNDAKGFAFSSRRRALTLKVHCESTSGSIVGAGAEKTMGLILLRFFHFTFWAVRKDTSCIPSQVHPKIAAEQSFGDFGMSQVKHAVMGETDERFPGLGRD